MYITIPSSGVGGAERRFSDIFIGLVEKGYPVFLVIPKFLYPKLFENISQDYSKNIYLLDMDKWSFLKFLYQYSKFFIKNVKSGDHFHYPLNPLFMFHLFNNTTYSISLCCSVNIPNFKTKSGGYLLQRLSLNSSKNIDILNVRILDIFVKKFPNYISKTTLTPGGTYIRKINLEKKIKKNKFTLISRLIPEKKGIETYLEMVPQIHTYIKNKYSLVVPFYVFGEGVLKQFVIEKINSLKESGIDINYGGFVAVENILPSTKCVFSMQETTNYPSRVIAEALSYGCNVIASDTGDTREFGEIKGLFYYSTIDELFSSIDDVMNEKFDTKEIADEAVVRFSSKEYIDYFYRIFSENSCK